MNRAAFKRQWRAARIYIRDEGSRQQAAFWFHELAPLFESRSALHSIPVAARDVPAGTRWACRDHRTMAEVRRDENRALLLSPPIGPVGRLP